MVYVPVTNVAQVNLQFTYLGENVENTLHFQGAAAWTTATLDDLCQQASDWWETHIKPSVSNALVMQSQVATDLTTQSAPSVEAVYNAGVTGDQTSPAMPGNNACVIKFSTLQRGRSYRGRNYVCGLVEGLVTGNSIASAVYTALVAGYASLAAAVTANGANHVVVSRYANNAPRALGVATEVVTYSSDGLVHSQRGRLD